MNLNQEFESEYLSLIYEAVNFGDKRPDRTTVGRRSLYSKNLSYRVRRFSYIKHDEISNTYKVANEYTIPLFTHRKINFKNAFEEFIFMFSGKTQTKELEAKGVNIWKGNTSKEFIEKNHLQLEEGDMGKMYGYNLRNLGGKLDQINELIEGIIKDPFSARHTLTTEDKTQTNRVLHCCHGVWIQFTINSQGKISLHYTQRSADLVLGVPVNLVFYTLFLIFIAEITGYEPEYVHCNMVDAHVYENQVDKIKEFDSDITKYDTPTIRINNDIKTIWDVENLNINDIELKYNSYKFIKFNMAV